MAAVHTRLRTLLTGALAASATVLAGGTAAAREPQPALSADALSAAAAAEGVAGKAVLYRDLWGVPHVYAAREEDGYFGLGWAQAEVASGKPIAHFNVSFGSCSAVRPPTLAG